MKVLHFTNSYYPIIGGIESVVENLSVQLQKKKIKSDVLTLNKVQGLKFSKTESHNGSKIFRIPFLDLKYYKISSIPFSLIKKYDIVHIHSLGFFSDVLLLTKFIHKKKIVVSTHGGIFHTKSIAGLKSFYFYTFQKLLLKNADAVIAVSKEDLRLFKKIYPKTILIENGITLPKAKGKKQSNSFLFVGRFSKNKRIDLLLETFAKLNKGKLVIAGNDFDNLLPKLKKKAKELLIQDNVEFKTSLTSKNMYKEYERAEYFVSAAEYEGFGITAIEAMHFGCIPILNNIPTFKDFCSQGRGYLVNYTNTKNTSQKIKNMIRKNNTKMSKKGIIFAKSFSWNTKINDFVNTYKSL